MSGFTLLLLSMLLAHVLGDFVLQRTQVVAGKQAAHWSAFLEHGLVHLAALEISTLLFVPLILQAAQTHLAFLALVVVHLLLDYGKECSSLGRRLGGGPGIFLGDQFVHGLTILATAWLISVPSPPVTGVQGWWASHNATILVLSLAYLSAIFACGYINAVLLRPLADKVPLQIDDSTTQTDGQKDPGLAQAGMVIGWLERFLILTAVLIGSPTAAALVVGAKSVFRFEGIRMGRRAAEYFLIGTFLSVSEAAVIGLAALYLLG